MAYETPVLLYSWVAGADLSEKQYYAVLLTNGVLQLAGDGERAIGVLQDKPESGYAGSVMLNGITKMEIGGTVVEGGPVGIDASGKGVPADTSDVIIGIALEAGVDGDIISVFLASSSKI